MLIANPQEPTAATVRVKVARAFYFAGEPQPIGAEIELDIVFALDLASVGKVVILDPVPEGPRSSASARRDELWKAKLP